MSAKDVIPRVMPPPPPTHTQVSMIALTASSYMYCMYSTYCGFYYFMYLYVSACTYVYWLGILDEIHKDICSLSLNPVLKSFLLLSMSYNCFKSSSHPLHALSLIFLCDIHNSYPHLVRRHPMWSSSWV